MRYPQMTHRISVAWLHARFKGDDVLLLYEITSKMRADSYTKVFTDPGRWEAACWHIGVIAPGKLDSLVALGDEVGGGRACRSTVARMARQISAWRAAADTSLSLHRSPSWTRAKSAQGCLLTSSICIA